MDKKTVLIVEDERYYNRGMGEELEENGYEVKWAASGDEALKLLELGEISVDLIILDIMMPSGTHLIDSKGGRRTGVKLCEYLRRTLGLRTPIIFHTVVEDEDVHHEIERIERDARLRPNILVKPVTPLDFLKRVKEVIGEPSQPGLA
jgi:CheY-like chemotaxis protein